MGVDRSSFACYGARIQLNDGADIDDLDHWLGGQHLGYVEWGSRSYGGKGGFIVCHAGSAIVIDEDYSSCERIPEMALGDARSLGDRIDAAIAAGAPFTVTSDIAWWAGGHTW